MWGRTVLGAQAVYVLTGGFKMNTYSRFRWMESRRIFWRMQQAEALHVKRI